MSYLRVLRLPYCSQVCVCVRPDVDGENAHDAGDGGAAGGHTLGDRGVLLLCVYQQRRQVGGSMGAGLDTADTAAGAAAIAAAATTIVRARPIAKPNCSN